MPGNSQRKGAVRKTGKGIGNAGRTAGSGGRVRRGLEGKGPTPRAEDRPYHKAYRKRGPDEAGKGGGKRSVAGASQRVQSAGLGPEWVIGRNPVYEALQAGLPVRRAYLMEGVERDSRLADILRLAAERSVPLLQASRLELDKLTGGGVHQGVAIQLPEYTYAHPTDLLHDALDAGEAALVVACDSVTDPRNLGAIVRSAAAWKASAGAAARCPVALATNLNRVLREYAEAGFVVVGLAGEGETPVDEVPGVDGPVLLVVGSEGEGLAQLTRKTCDVLASIPIASQVESLNASVAASIALYAVTRARAEGA